MSSREQMIEMLGLIARLNSAAGTGSATYPINPNDDYWTLHPDPGVDVAVLSLNTLRLNEDGIDYQTIHRDSHTFTRGQLLEKEIGEGDGIFTMGFPLGLAGNERNYVIVRQGVVASIQNWLDGSEKTFLVDASIYPGNSGGPVFTKPEAIAIEGTTVNDSCTFIGVVSGFLPYADTAISLQTNRPRVTFEENSGLGVIVPNDLIQETIRVALTNYPTVTL